jgi:ferritin
MNNLQILLNHLEHSARVALGCWSDARFSGHNGLAAFFLYEESERRKDVLQIANHMAGDGHKVLFETIPAVNSEYATCVDATTALFNCYDKNLHAAKQVHESMITDGDDVYFMNNFVKKLECELEEAKKIWTLLQNTEKESLPAMNKHLLSEYGR